VEIVSIEEGSEDPIVVLSNHVSFAALFVGVQLEGARSEFFHVYVAGGWDWLFLESLDVNLSKRLDLHSKTKSNYIILE
jgi:hypothetical protein